MPSIRRGRLLPLTIALALAAPAAARAQDKPIDLGASNLEDLTGEGSRTLQITGFGVGDYTYDQLTRDNSARAGKLALALFREVNDRIWFFGQLTTALVSGEEAAEAGDEIPTEIEIDNLLVNFTPGGASGFSLSFGKFDVPLGFERDDEPLNFQATNSFNYELGRPAKMVGLVGRWALSPHVDLTAIGGNGWDAQVDPNHAKTGGFRLGLLPSENASFGLGGLLGAEGKSDDLQNRWLLTADYALEMGHDWILGGEANLGGESDALAAGDAARWYGATLSLFHRLSDHVGWTVRGETFRDRDGVRTGTVQTLQSITFTPMVFVGTGREGIFANVEHTTFRIPRFQLRADVRMDHASDALFEDADGDAHAWSTHFVLQLVTTF